MNGSTLPLREECDCDRLGLSLDECIYDDPCPAKETNDD